MDQPHATFVYDGYTAQCTYDNSGSVRTVDVHERRTNMTYDAGLIADEPIITERVRENRPE